MRLAFVDLVFSWPPNGGADVDLYHTMCGLQKAGHDVHLFVSACERSWERGAFDPDALPFPATRLAFTARTLKDRIVASRFRGAVDAWRPDAVFVCDGFFLKPSVILALNRYPTAGRFYAYEVGCMRDMQLFKDGAPCPCDYLRTPRTCRRCALDGMKAGIKQWRFNAIAHEFIAAKAYMPGYHKRLAQSLAKLDAVIVSNEIMKGHLGGLNDNVYIFPGGVNVSDYAHHPPETKREQDRKIILMVGRVEDPMKGLATLREAGECLSAERTDFEIRATHTDHTLNNDWFTAIGWHDHESLKAIYQEADICVVPSIWEEPFGLVAVESMASGRPVVASRVGGLQTIVAHEETGFLFDREDSASLARQLGRLLDDGDLRRRMGEAGRKRAELKYDWDRIIETHYPPLLEKLVP